jgi:hypothetical protein
MRRPSSVKRISLSDPGPLSIQTPEKPGKAKTEADKLKAELNNKLLNIMLENPRSRFQFIFLCCLRENPKTKTEFYFYNRERSVTS